MKPGSIFEWLRPTLGAALLLAGAAGIAYKVISGYRHAAPEAFVSVQDQNKQPAASAANPAAVPTPSADVARSPQSSASAAPAVATNADIPADARDDSTCDAIKTEQHEIEKALNKKYSAEEGRYMQRRMRELAEQSAKHQCGE